MLPVEQETHEILQGDGLDFPAQALDRITMDACQQVAFAPLRVVLAGAEPTAQYITFCLEARQGLLHLQGLQVQWQGDFTQAQGAETTQPGANQLHQCLLRVVRFIEAGQWRQ
ncbi:hypothetical protein D3C85_1586530 [compost metagenome]